MDGVPVVPEPPPLYSVPASTPVATPDAGSQDLILLRLPLANLLAPGASATLRLGFTTTVPLEPVDGIGPFVFMPDTGRWTLAHWFPILAGLDPAFGWETDPPAAWADVTFSNTALFDVTLTAPDDLVLGDDWGRGGRSSRATPPSPAIRQWPSRDSPPSWLIPSWPPLAPTSTAPGSSLPATKRGRRCTDPGGAQALTIFSELFGPYPYATLDLVAVPGVVGHEFPQLIFIGADYYPDPLTSGSRPGAVEFLVAHEVAHQWRGLVGNNPHRHAFLDEGLAEYAPSCISSDSTGWKPQSNTSTGAYVFRM